MVTSVEPWITLDCGQRVAPLISLILTVTVSTWSQQWRYFQDRCSTASSMPESTRQVDYTDPFSTILPTRVIIVRRRDQSNDRRLLQLQWSTIDKKMEDEHSNNWSSPIRTSRQCLILPFSESPVYVSTFTDVVCWKGSERQKQRQKRNVKWADLT